MKTMLALTALGGLLCAAPAMAAAPAETATHVVNYTDLDLRTERGQSRLDRRLEIAVSAACGTPSSADPAGRNAIRRCKAETMERLTTQRDQAIAAAQGSPERLAASGSPSNPHD